MGRFSEYLKDNTRFALAILVNFIALCIAIWWLVDSNLIKSDGIQFEPIVTTVALAATLLGLNFVNDKLSKPYLKVLMNMSIAYHPIIGQMTGINVTVENHSMIKAFIKNFQVKLPTRKERVQFLFDGFTGEPLKKVVLEPGQAFSFSIVKENLVGAPENVDQFGDFVVTTDIGHQFTVPAKEFKRHYRVLMQAKK